MEKVWTVYILECGDGTLYTGITDDLARRFQAHSQGKGAKYTRGRGPLILRYREEMPDKGAALKREYDIKRMKKSEKKLLICEKQREMDSMLAISSDMAYTEDEEVCSANKNGEE